MTMCANKWSYEYHMKLVPWGQREGRDRPRPLQTQLHTMSYNVNLGTQCSPRTVPPNPRF